MDKTNEIHTAPNIGRRFLAGFIDYFIIYTFTLAYLFFFGEQNEDGEYVAATQVCSHENKSKIILKDDEWFCTAHDARFDLSGDGLNDLGKNGLTTYNVEEIDTNTLRVFSK